MATDALTVSTVLFNGVAERVLWQSQVLARSL